MAVTNDASIVAVMGQSGQGKGVYIKQRLTREAPARLLIWDPKNEYESFARGQPSLSHLAAAVMRCGRRASFRYRYRPKGEPGSAKMAREFATFCKLAQGDGEKFGGNMTIVAEELSFVTRPSYAPPAWASVCNAGRHDGLRVIGLSQFPAQIDKSILSNATEVVCFYLGELPHRKVVARKLDVPESRIKSLRQFTYLHFDRDARTVTEATAYPPGYSAASAPAVPQSGPVAVPGNSDSASGLTSPSGEKKPAALFGT